jgi:hypothetical protein
MTAEVEVGDRGYGDEGEGDMEEAEAQENDGEVVEKKTIKPEGADAVVESADKRGEGMAVGSEEEREAIAYGAPEEECARAMVMGTRGRGLVVNAKGAEEGPERESGPGLGYPVTEVLPRPFITHDEASCPKLCVYTLIQINQIRRKRSKPSKPGTSFRPIYLALHVLYSRWPCLDRSVSYARWVCLLYVGFAGFGGLVGLL